MGSQEDFFKIDLTIPIRQNRFNGLAQEIVVALPGALNKLSDMPVNVFLCEHGNAISKKHIGKGGADVYVFTIMKSKNWRVIGAAYFEKSNETLFLRFCDILCCKNKPD